MSGLVIILLLIPFGLVLYLAVLKYIFPENYNFIAKNMEKLTDKDKKSPTEFSDNLEEGA